MTFHGEVSKMRCRTAYFTGLVGLCIVILAELLNGASLFNNSFGFALKVRLIAYYFQKNFTYFHPKSFLSRKLKKIHKQITW